MPARAGCAIASVQKGFQLVIVQALMQNVDADSKNSSQPNQLANFAISSLSANFASSSDGKNYKVSLRLSPGYFRFLNLNGNDH